MLVVSNMSHMRKCLAFAASKGQLERLLERLWYLHTYATDDRSQPRPELATGDNPLASWEGLGAQTTCNLRPDFAPASFDFTLLKAGDVWFVGGLIYHGAQDGWTLADGSELDGYVPTLAVLVGHTDNPWSVHT